MTSNAQKIADWRLANPHTQITEAILLTVLGLETLRRADLCGADLYNADLRWANLYGAELCGAVLREADLRWANLSWADLYDADLCEANLYGADLWWADLGWVNLSGVNLHRANLSGADLPGYMPLKTPSGEGDIRATPDGWRVRLGCWDNKTLEDLKALIADDVEWPEAEGDEREKRRPFLVATAALMEAQAAYYPNLITELAEKWN